MTEKAQKMNAPFRCQCSVCGYLWLAKVENPKRCPKCNARMMRNSRILSKTIKEHLEKYVEKADKEYQTMPLMERMNTDLEDMLWKEGKRQFPTVPPLRLEKIVRKVLVDYIVKKHGLAGD